MSGVNFKTTVNPDVHEVVIVIEGTALGFTSIPAATGFLSEVYAGQDNTKLYIAIATAMSDDKEDGIQIYDIATYRDMFMDEDGDDD